MTPNSTDHPRLSDNLLELELTRQVDGNSVDKLVDELDPAIYQGKGFRPPTPAIARGDVERHEATNTRKPYRTFVNQHNIDTDAMEDELTSISEYLLDSKVENSADTTTAEDSKPASVPVLLYYPVIGGIHRHPLPTYNQYLGRITATDPTPPVDSDRAGPSITFSELHACTLGTPTETVVNSGTDETATFAARRFKLIWIPTARLTSP